MDLALIALDHAAESVVASGGPLVPFAMIEVDGNVSLSRFAGDREEGQQRTRNAVKAATNATRAALRCPGRETHVPARSATGSMRWRAPMLLDNGPFRRLASSAGAAASVVNYEGRFARRSTTSATTTATTATTTNNTTRDCTTSLEVGAMGFAEYSMLDDRIAANCAHTSTALTGATTASIRA